MNQIETLLRSKNLRVTPTRLEILNMILDADHALSYKQLDNLSGGKFDKVTIYRTLNTLKEKGLIHEINGEDGMLYNSCEANCSEREHKDAHVHFECDQCGNTYCLYDTTIPAVNVPDGYMVDSVKLKVAGICVECRR